MEYPKHVYKLGTGKKLDDNGMHTAESAVVKSKEEYAALGAEWCENPVEATVPETKPEPKDWERQRMLSEVHAKPEEKYLKKVK